MSEITDESIRAIRQIIDEGRFQEALDECRALLFEDPQNQEVLALLREATEGMESGAPASSSRASSYEEEPLDEEGDGDDEGAESTGLSGEDQERLKALVDEGEEAFAAGRFQQAIDVWSRIYIVDLNNTRAQKLVDRARKALDEELRRFDEIIQDANDLLERKDYDGAAARFKEVLEESPQHPEATEGLERIEQSKRDEAERESKSKQLLAKASKLLKDGATAEATYTLEKLLESEPGNVRARQMLDSARRASGEHPVLAEPTGSGRPRTSGPVATRPAAASASSDAPQGADSGALPLPYSGNPLPKFLGIAALAAVIVGGSVYALLSSDPMGDVEIDFDQLVTATPEQTPDVPSSPVEDLLPASLDPETTTALDKELSANPSYPLAKKAYVEGRFEEAMGIFRTLSTEVPDNALVKQHLHRCLFNTAVLALRGGDAVTAAGRFSEALAMEPQDSVAQRGLKAARNYEGKAADDRLRWYGQLLPLRK